MKQNIPEALFIGKMSSHNTPLCHMYGIFQGKLCQYMG